MLHPLHVLRLHPIRGGGLTVIDISLAQDKSIVMWYDAATTTQYWYSDRDVIYMNPNSSSLFKNCSKLTSLDLSMFNTSKVTNMDWMFSVCRKMTQLNIWGWDVSNVTSFTATFNGCNALTSLDVSHWDTSRVTSTNTMFYGCTSLTRLDVSRWNMSNNQVLCYTFYYCSKLTSLDLSNWDTSKAFNMVEMFGFSSLLTTITYGPKFTNIALPLTSTDTSNNMSWKMYGNCPANKPNWAGGAWISTGTFVKTANLADKRIFEPSINSLATSLNRSTTPPDTGGGLTVFDISKEQNRSILTWYDPTSTKQYFYTEYIKITFPDNTSNYFYCCNNMTDIDDFLRMLDTSKVTSMNRPFCYIKATHLDVSGFDVSNFDMFNWFFGDCQLLTSIDLSTWNNTKVTNIQYMFQGCSKLVSIDLSHLDLSNVVIAAGLFNNCESLTNFNISNLNISKLTSLRLMFNSCSKLTSLDVSGWDTSNITDMSNMFGAIGCTSLDLSSFDTSKVTNMSQMFYWFGGLTNVIYGPKFVNTNVTNFSEMFGYNYSANKPNWTNGTWDSKGTFIKNS